MAMKSAKEMFFFYKDMEKKNPESSVLREVQWKYADMARGGDGGEEYFERDGETTCRGINYKGYPDSFFQEVCALMNWEY